MSQIVNTFNNGLVMDFNPLTVPEGSLVNCLNGTFLTYNGNELVLQNDMGNGKIETAKLPAGYIPLGITELGGIIYVVSYNPLNNKCQIGSFPSPERNFTPEDYKDNPNLQFVQRDFIKDDKIKSYKVKKDFTGINLHPGDKFKLVGKFTDDAVHLTNLDTEYTALQSVKLSLGAVNQSGEVVTLDNLKTFENELADSTPFTNFIQDTNKYADGTTEEYNAIVSSEYNVYTGKSIASLCLIGELEVLDQFSILWDVVKVEEEANSVNKVYTIKLHLNWNSESWKQLSTNPNIQLPSINTQLAGLQLTATLATDISIESITFPNAPTLDVSNGKIDWDINFEELIRIINTNIEEDISIEQFLQKLSNEGITIKVKHNIANNGNITFELTPKIKLFDSVYLQETLIQALSIDLNKVGTGTKELNEWRYYKNDNELLLNYGLDIYEKPDEEITQVQLSMYDYVNITRNTQINQLTDPAFTITKKNLRSFSGKYMENLVLDTKYNTVTQDGLLKANWLYLVKIDICYKSSESPEEILHYYYYRWLYTARVFNDDYSTNIDFNFLNPRVELSTNFNLELTSQEKDTSTSVYKTTMPNVQTEEIVLEKVDESFKTFFNTDPGTDRYIHNIKNDCSETYKANPQVVFEDDFNFFKADMLDVRHEIVAENLEFTSQITKNILFDSSYNSNVENLLNAVYTNEIDGESERADFSNVINGTLNIIIGYRVNNPLSYTYYEEKDLPYTKVLLPCIYDEASAKQYGLQLQDDGHFYYNSFPCVSYYGENMHQGIGKLKLVGNVVTGLGFDKDLFKANGEWFAQDSWQWRDISNALASSFSVPESTIIPFFGITGKGGSNCFRWYQVSPETWKWGTTYTNAPVIGGDWTGSSPFATWDSWYTEWRLLGICMMKSEDNDRLCIINNFAPMKSGEFGMSNITIGDSIVNALSQIYFLQDPNKVPPKKYFVISNLHYFGDINFEKTIQCTLKTILYEEQQFIIAPKLGENNLVDFHNVTIKITNGTEQLIETQQGTVTARILQTDKKFVFNEQFEGNFRQEINLNVSNTNAVFLQDGQFVELSSELSSKMLQNRLYQCVLNPNGDIWIKDITRKGTILAGGNTATSTLNTGAKDFKLLTYRRCSIDDYGYFNFNRADSKFNTTAHYLSDLKCKDGKLVIASGKYTSNPNYKSSYQIVWDSDDSHHKCGYQYLSFGICFDDNFNVLGTSLK